MKNATELMPTANTARALHVHDACKSLRSVASSVHASRLWLVTVAHARDEINSTVCSWSSLASGDDTLFTVHTAGACQAL